MNCIVIDDDPIIQKQLGAFINKSELLNLIGTFKNPVEALSVVQNNKVDLVFLDIEMPEMSGLEYLEEFKSNFQTIVISGDRKYALDTFEYGVTDYLLKPIEYDRFIKSVNRSIERNHEANSQVNKEKFFIKVGSKFVRFKFDDIIAVKFEDDKRVLLTKNKSYNLLNDFFDINNIINRKNFFRISDKYVVNLNEILDIKDREVVFKSSEFMEHVEVSEDKTKEILNIIS